MSCHRKIFENHKSNRKHVKPFKWIIALYLNPHGALYYVVNFLNWQIKLLNLLSRFRFIQYHADLKSYTSRSSALISSSVSNLSEVEADRDLVMLKLVSAW